MFYLGIDPGKLNIGIVICKLINNTDSNDSEPRLHVLLAERIKYQSDTKFIQTIISYLYLHNIKATELTVVIERQGHNASISSNMRFVQGYLTALGSVVIMMMPITYRMKISNYKDRKDYSLNLCLERLKEDRISNSEIITKALEKDDRKHDMADGLNLLYNYIFIKGSLQKLKK